MKKFLALILIGGLIFQPAVFGAASYPTSVKSFTTKVDNVDDVMAEDINGLQDEVVAIETALGVGKSTSVIQVVNVMSGSVATGSTALPYDDTIPQNTEGTEFMTLAITPKSATNKLKIEVVVNGAVASDNVGHSAALFQDTTAGALAAVYGMANIGTNPISPGPLTFTHYMDAGTTSETTFKVRAGGTSGTFTFNGISAGRKFGGVMASSITITELKA